MITKKIKDFYSMKTLNIHFHTYHIALLLCNYALMQLKSNAVQCKDPTITPIIIKIIMLKFLLNGFREVLF